MIIERTKKEKKGLFVFLLLLLLPLFFEGSNLMQICHGGRKDE